MALQLLNKSYLMGGPDYPKILKLPQGEYRSTRRSPNVSVSDVLMNVRMDNGKNRFIQEHVSKYSQGLSPYGEWSYPYKINKNFRPPIIPQKDYAPLSRMPVKFDNIGAGPIVRDLFQKKMNINQVVPKTIIDRVYTDVGTNVSLPIQSPNNEQCREKYLPEKTKASIPYWPSMPVHMHRPGTGVPEIELDPKMIIRPNMGIHAPFTVSDQSRDVLNMRTPTHIAMNPNLKIPGATLDNNYLRQGPDLTPKVQTAAWFNPGYTIYQPNCNRDARTREPLNVASGTNIGRVDRSVNLDSNRIENRIIQEPLHVSSATNVSWISQEAERGVTTLDDPLHYGSFEPKVYSSQIGDHQTFTRVSDKIKPGSFQERFQTSSLDEFNYNSTHSNIAMNSRAVKNNMSTLNPLQESRVDRTFIQTYE